MAVTFNDITAGATNFGELIDSDATWVRLFTSATSDVSTGSYVDTSAFNEFGNGWIEVSDLDDLEFDYAQYNDKKLYAAEWDDDAGALGDYEEADVDFSTSTAVQDSIVTEISEETPLDEMFTVKNTDAGEQWFKVWIGKEVDGSYEGDYVNDGKWIKLEDLGDFTVTEDQFEDDNQLYIRQASKAEGGDDYYYVGWENWDVDPDTPGETFELTANADDITGTAGDDTFDGTRGTDPFGEDAQTWQDWDKLDGNGGTNELIAVVGGEDIDFENGGGSLDNIQTLELRASIDDSNITFNEDVNDVETIINNGSTDDMTIEDIQNMVDVGIESLPDDSDFTLEFLDDVVTAANTDETAFNLELSDVRRTDANTIDTDLTVQNSSGDASFENVEITTTGTRANYLNSLEMQDSVLSMTLTGTSALQIEGGDIFSADAHTVNASDLESSLELTVDNATGTTSNGLTFTGAQGGNTITFDSLDLNDAATDVSITGGDGDDTFVDTSDSFAALGNYEDVDLTIDGGEGRNTLITNSVTLGANGDQEEFLAENISNIQVLGLAENTTTLELEEFTFIEEIVLTGGDIDNDNTISNFSGNTLVFDGTGNLDGKDIKITNAEVDAITTLNIQVTEDGINDGKIGDLQVTDGTNETLETINVSLENDFDLRKAYDFRDALAGVRDFTVNVTGEGDFTSAGFTLGADDPDSLTFDISAEGTQNVGKVDVSELAEAGSLYFEGSSDVTVDSLTFGAAPVDELTLDMSGTGAVTITTLAEATTINDGITFTINSENGEDANVFDIENTAGGLTLGDDADGDAKLVITGDQDLTIQDTDGDGITFVDKDDAGKSQEIDASTFTGDLVLPLERITDASQTNAHTIKLGTGDSTVNIDNEVDNANAHTFIFEFNADGIGDVTVSEFNDAGNATDDVLNFEDFDWSVDLADSTLIEAGQGVANDDDFDAALGKLDTDGDNFTLLATDETELLTFTNDDGDIIITAANDQFQGQIEITGVAETLGEDNFDI